MSDNPSKEDWRDAIASAVMDQARAANFTPPAPQGYDGPLPMAAIEGGSMRDLHNPRMRGEMTVPALGGSVTMGGNYQLGSPAWGVTARYNKQF